MKFTILTILSFVLSLGVANAAPITKDIANKYYEGCTSQPAEGLSEKSKEYMCACTAAKMIDYMTVEDIQAMSQQNEVGRKALNYMIVKVYAPCMNYPAKDHYYNTCISNPKTQTLTANPQGLCNCMSDKVANYLGSNASEIFQGILARNPTITDPMVALTEDPDFKKFAQSQILSCVIK